MTSNIIPFQPAEASSAPLSFDFGGLAIRPLDYDEKGLTEIKTLGGTPCMRAVPVSGTIARSQIEDVMEIGADGYLA